MKITATKLQEEMKTKSKRRLWAIYHKHSAGSTARYLRPERSKARHEAAWAEITRRAK
jgi:hypothetical protein